MSEPLRLIESDYDHARKTAVDAIVIPLEDTFLQDYQQDDRLMELATVLIHHCEELRFIEDFSVTYLWKRTGGKSKGRMTLGTCTKTAGLVHFFCRTDYVIWVAADHLQYLHVRARAVNIAALMYHELRHIAQTEKGEPAIQGHEFEGFASEIDRFGIWRDDMRPIACAFQESLFSFQDALDADPVGRNA